jgi:hypothetical protein
MVIREAFRVLAVDLPVQDGGTGLTEYAAAVANVVGGSSVPHLVTIRWPRSASVQGWARVRGSSLSLFHRRR